MMTIRKLSKLLLDIRIYSSRKEENIALSLFPDADLSERYALKLKEFKLLTPGYDHIFLYLSTSVSHGEIKFEGEEGRVIKFECGITEDLLRQKSELEVEDFFIGLMTKALYFLSSRDGLDKALINNVDLLMRSERENLEINCIEKKIGQNLVRVFFTLSKVSNLKLSLVDITSGIVKSVFLTRLIDPRDAYILVSKLEVKNRKLLIYPRNSNVAQMRFRNYYLLDLDKCGLLSEEGDAICISIDQI